MCSRGPGPQPPRGAAVTPYGLDWGTLWRVLTLLTAVVSLVVGFFGGRSTDRYRRAQDRRDDLTDRCDDVLNEVALLFEGRPPGGDVHAGLDDLWAAGRAMQRTADRYLDGRSVPRLAGTPSGRGLAQWLRMAIRLHSPLVDTTIVNCLHQDLRFSLRDLPVRSEGLRRKSAEDDPWKSQAESVLALEVRELARIALTLRDAVTGRHPSKNRGLHGSTRQYLFERGRLPNPGLAERSGVVQQDDW